MSTQEGWEAVGVSAKEAVQKGGCKNILKLIGIAIIVALALFYYFLK